MNLSVIRSASPRWWKEPPIGGASGYYPLIGRFSNPRPPVVDLSIVWEPFIEYHWKAVQGFSKAINLRERETVEDLSAA